MFACKYIGLRCKNGKLFYLTIITSRVCHIFIKLGILATQVHFAHMPSCNSPRIDYTLFSCSSFLILMHFPLIYFLCNMIAVFPDKQK